MATIDLASKSFSHLLDTTGRPRHHHNKSHSLEDITKPTPSVERLFGDRKRKKTAFGEQPSIISNISNRSPESHKRWNVFRAPPRDQDVFESRWTILLSQAFKAVCYIFMQALVLCCCVAAKLSLMMITAGLKPGLDYTPCTPTGYMKQYIPQDSKMVPDGVSSWFYLSLLIAICVPEVLTFIRCVRIVSFKFVPAPSIEFFVLAFLVESLQTIGRCVFVFIILPHIDAIRGVALCCAVASVPLLLSSFTRLGSGTKYRHLMMSLDMIAFVAQITAFWLWPSTDSKLDHLHLLPGCLLAISLGWWENFVTKSSRFECVVYLGRMKERLHKCRYKMYLLIAPWKCILGFFCMMLSSSYFHHMETVFSVTNPIAYYNATITDIDDQLRFDYANTVFKVMLVLVFGSYGGYQTGKYACRVKMDKFVLAIPVILTPPACIALLVSYCEARRLMPCYFASFIPDYMFWNCDYGDSLYDLLVARFGWGFFIWFIGYIWCAQHLFLQRTRRLAKTDALFVLPNYDGLLLDQSLALNRRRQNNFYKIKPGDLIDNPASEAHYESLETTSTDLSIAMSMTSLSLNNRNADSITKIYICATMWHETTVEMVQMLKSIMRMDEDQSARKNAQKYLKVVDKDYYELETHIFFDDAWHYDESIQARVPNDYVKQFCSVVDTAASSVHQVKMQLQPPTKFTVPYGGRIVWSLPGDSRLFLHLKDREKVRHKKRWSQVMYMYFLLGHRIMELIPDVNRKQLLADNTYLLTIDGDSKFSPASVAKLVDLMKTNMKLGAACGRIHPIGSGIMVWYQKFEYAIAHWFQKAAEHVFGCVLCSPGCFSLFRASALMDDNVMSKYTKIAIMPRHFVQYDQGEDRWLSTLLLKQGYRIEYAAAADADTYAPEGFNEFFNQRRRWTPSSIANTLDLLLDYKRAVSNNDSISKLYILYQCMVILFSMLGPAIIFSMMVYAQSAAFNVSSSVLMWSNMVPIILYVVLCFVASSTVQIGCAKFFAVGYAFIMMAVLVGTGIQIALEGLASPISIFVVTLAAVFVAGAFLHPRELINIFYGFVFFLCIPCTYVLMSLYALINLNVINWGTREAASKVTGEADSDLGRLLKFFKGTRKDNGESKGPGIGCGRICRCTLCPVSDEDDEATVALLGNGRRGGNAVQRLEHKLEFIDRQLQGAMPYFANRPGGMGVVHYRPSSMIQGTHDLPNADPVGRMDSPPPGPMIPKITVTHDTPTMERLQREREDHQSVQSSPISRVSNLPERMDSFEVKRYRSPIPDDSFRLLPRSDKLFSGSNIGISPVGCDLTEDLLLKSGVTAWTQLDYMKNGPEDVLDEIEHQFWVDFVKEYLTPISKTKEQEKDEAIGLKELRNKVAFGLLLVNGLLILVIYLLQLNKELLSIRWDPTGDYHIKEWDPDEREYVLKKEPLKIEPMGFTIILFLSIILLVQTIGMLFHRFHTMTHVLATTELACFRRQRKNMDPGDELLNSKGVEIARNLQKLAMSETPTSGSVNFTDYSDERTLSGRPKKVVLDIERGLNRRSKNKGLQQAFQRRFFTFNADQDSNSLRDVQLDDNPVFGLQDSAKKIAAGAISKRRDAMLKQATEQFESSSKGRPSYFTETNGHTLSKNRAAGMKKIASADALFSPTNRLSADLDELLTKGRYSRRDSFDGTERDRIKSVKSSLSDSIEKMVETFNLVDSDSDL